MDPNVVGLECEPFEMLVEVGKVREFARATKSSNPAHLEGWTPVMPPTFLAAAAFWMEPRHSPTLQADLDFERILNGAQEFTFFGPPPSAGTKLTGRGRVDKFYEKEGRRGGTMQFLEVVYEYVDEAGVKVAEVRSTVIETAGVVGAA